jgi:putative endonuclease
LKNCYRQKIVISSHLSEGGGEKYTNYLFSMNQYFVYIVSCNNLTLFYTGVTNDLLRRVYEHKNKLVPGYTSRYNLDKLLYYESFEDPVGAIQREKQIKKYSQKKKIMLIQTINIGMYDLYDQLSGQ